MPAYALQQLGRRSRCGLFELVDLRVAHVACSVLVREGASQAPVPRSLSDKPSAAGIPGGALTAAVPRGGGSGILGAGGGHGARKGRSTSPFVPVMADLAAPAPVPAAGGITDGRGVAAALAPSAAGALLGTRFQATREALVDPAAAEASVAAGRTRNAAPCWTSPGNPGGRRAAPRRTARTLPHPFPDGWRGPGGRIRRRPRARRDYREGVASGDLPSLPVRAGEGAGLTDDLPYAAGLVGVLPERAARAPARAGWQ
ncbi:nitronate monooxygenase [Streptomyces sediminimaris]|uniref:nitronate monooxygenase n=1 Tax=Streptomyces sediminimaris TaxID=3383721 RepID=UPI00399AC191